jgi:photosystem II stability/assembly factor-like uncharacterized protein
MFRGKTVHLALLLVSCSSLTVFGQWSAANSGTTNNLNGVYLLDSGIALAVGDAGTILKSTDAGATWAPLLSGTTNTLYEVYFLDGNQGVAVGDQGLILRTTDGGAMWQNLASGVKDALRSVFFFGANGISGGDSQTILYSIDSGASWQISQSGFFGGGFPGAHMLSPSIGFVAGQNSIFAPLVGASTDGGVTWPEENFHTFLFDNNEGGCTDVRFLDVNIGVVSGSVFDGRGAIARTTDGGLNWFTQFFDQPIEGLDFPVTNTTNVGFAGGWGGRILHTTNMGIAWTDQASGTFANLNDVSFANDALRGIAVGDSGTILWTANGGGPGPTPTPSVTPTSTPTPSVSPTATPRATPTARPRPTPARRPTP